MVTVTDLRHVKSAGGGDASRYAIVRSMSRPIAGVEQMDVLSPSKDLFFWYRRMANAGKWDETAFRTEYLPRFLREIRANPDARRTLKDLWRRSRDGESIVLACFCQDEAMCHRSIVAGLLSGTGADVKTQSGTDYSRYYAMYKELS